MKAVEMTTNKIKKMKSYIVLFKNSFCNGYYEEAIGFMEKVFDCGGKKNYQRMMDLYRCYYNLNTVE